MDNDFGNPSLHRSVMTVSILLKYLLKGNNQFLGGIVNTKRKIEAS